MSLIQIKTRQFIAKYFGWAAKVWYTIWIKIQLRINPKDIILILTPGKVGSSSMYYSLKNSLSNPIYHIHYFSSKGILKSSEEHLSSDRKSLPLHLIKSKILRKEIIKNNRKVVVISLIREPIERFVSSFFQNIDFYKKSFQRNDLSIDIEKSVKHLEKNCSKDICADLELWFDQEICNNFGVNVFDLIKTQGYFRSDSFPFILFRLEDLSNSFFEGLSSILLIPETLDLDDFNIGDAKYYSEDYKKVKDLFKIDDKVINEIFDSKVYSFFYKDLTQQARKRWTKKI